MADGTQPDDRAAQPENKSRSEADAELEREIRKGRQFSLADAIGQLAGPGMMKGVSPITRKQQANLEIRSFLNSQWTDAGDELRVALLRRVSESDLLLGSNDHPLVVLAAYVHQVLESSYLFEELVNEADIEWGRVVDERPHFQKEGSPPNPDDPYTFESVRASLTRLLAKLGTIQASTTET